MTAKDTNNTTRNILCDTTGRICISGGQATMATLNDKVPSGLTVSNSRLQCDVTGSVSIIGQNLNTMKHAPPTLDSNHLA